MQEQYLGRLTPDTAVFDMDGQKIGTIARVYRDEFATALTEAGAPAADVGGHPSRPGIIEVHAGPLGLGEHLYIPVSAIHDAAEECVFLAHKKNELPEEWHHKPDYFDELK